MQKTCFVIAPIGAEDSPQRKRSDDILKYVVTPAATTHGYAVVRADKISKPGIITQDIFDHLLNDALVVADLTDHNPNVFYELAVRHAIRKPVLQLIMQSQSIPFDIAQSRTIFYRYPDLESADRCQQEISAHIKALDDDTNAFDNPLSVAVTLQDLRISDNPLGKGISEILDSIQQLRQDIRLSTINSDEYFGTIRGAEDDAQLEQRVKILAETITLRAQGANRMIEEMTELGHKEISTNPDNQNVVQVLQNLEKQKIEIRDYFRRLRNYFIDPPFLNTEN